MGSAVRRRSTRKQAGGLTWIVSLTLVLLFAVGVEAFTYAPYGASAVAMLVVTSLIVKAAPRPWKAELPLYMPRSSVRATWLAAAALVAVHFLVLELVGWPLGRTAWTLLGNGLFCGLVASALQAGWRADLQRYDREGFRLKDALNECRQRVHELDQRVQEIYGLEQKTQDLLQRASKSRAHAPRTEQIRKGLELLKLQEKELQALRNRYQSLAEDIQIELDAMTLGTAIEDVATREGTVLDELQTLQDEHQRLIDLKHAEAQLERELQHP